MGLAVGAIERAVIANNYTELLGHVRSLQDKLGELVQVAEDLEPQSDHKHHEEQCALIRQILRLRENRRRIFGESIFGEPAWEVLLELYHAQLTGRRECVSSLCIASGVPSSTALRWIKALEEDGWLSRVPDPGDGRRYFMQLTDKAFDAMQRLFARVPLRAL